MKVRYYADTEVSNCHNHMLRLLRSIHDEHGISVEIDRITERAGPITDFPGDIRYSTAREVYERDLKNNRNLIENIDQQPSTAIEFDEDGRSKRPTVWYEEITVELPLTTDEDSDGSEAVEV
jgi:hypothetical protein